MNTTIRSLINQYKRMLESNDKKITQSLREKDISEARMLERENYILTNVIIDLETFLS